MAFGKVKDDAARVKRRLGRGLDSLISAPVHIEIPRQEPSAAAARPALTPLQSTAAAAEQIDESTYIQMLAPASIRPNARQPRQDFDEAALASLAASIKRDGLMQPVVVRPVPRGSGGAAEFELIAGERRWRAAKMLELRTIPAVVREVDDQTAAQWSLVENLQREDLNPMERADAFQRLIDDFGLSHQDIAERVGLDRTSVTNHLRLLELDTALREVIREGVLSMGHAKALLGLTNNAARQKLAIQIVREGLSVREAERRAKQMLDASAGVKAGPAGGGDKSPRQAQLEDLQKRLSNHLGTNVRIATGQKKGTGTLIIHFYNVDQFMGLLHKMGFKAQD